MHYTAIFHDCKNENFDLSQHLLDENCDIFLIFAQNIDLVYVRIASRTAIFVLEQK